MFDLIIREVASRFGLGDKAAPLVQMLLAFISNKDTGGLPGFMSKLSSSGLGDVAQSWLGGGANARPLDATQVESLLGGQSGLVGSITSKLGVDGTTASSALGFLLPAVIGKLTPGGKVPTSLSGDVMGFISGGASALVGGVSGAAGAAAATAGDLAGGVANAAAAGVGAATGAAGALVGSAGQMLGGAANAVGGVANAGAGAAVVAASKVAGSIGQVAGGAASAGRGAASAVGGAASAGANAAAAAGGGLMKWLPWVGAAVAAALLLSYCSKGNDPTKAVKEVAQSAATTTTQAAGSAVNAATDAANTAATAATATAGAAASAVGDAAANAAKAAADTVAAGVATAGNATSNAAATAVEAVANVIPAEGGLFGFMFDGMPALKVYFGTGKTAVAGDFGSKAKEVLEFLKTNPEAKAIVSGYNDPRGNAAANERLSSGRATNVAAALVASGVAKERVMIEKPANPTDGSEKSNEEARRVEVTLRK